jgi:hypothetical protein
MIIRGLDASTKQATFEFTEQEWEVLQWVNSHRSQAWLIQWFEQRFAALGQSRELDLFTEVKHKWRMADQATKDQIKTLLGV